MTIKIDGTPFELLELNEIDIKEKERRNREVVKRMLLRQMVNFSPDAIEVISGLIDANRGVDGCYDIPLKFDWKPTGMFVTISQAAVEKPMWQDTLIGSALEHLYFDNLKIDESFRQQIIDEQLGQLCVIGEK